MITQEIPARLIIAMTDSTISWQQSLTSYQKSLAFLSKFIEQETLNELEALGSIHAFEVALDTAGKLLRDYARFQGIQNIYGPKDAARAASKLGLISNSDLWFEMIGTRNQEYDFYRLEVVEEIFTDIKERFFDSMLLLQSRMQLIHNKLQAAQS